MKPDIQKISQQQNAQQGGVNGAQKTGSFRNRIVEVAEPVNIAIAAVAVGCYLLNVPLLVIGTGVGCVMLARRQIAVYIFAQNLEKIKSSDSRDERLLALDELIKDFDNVSDEKQVAAIKAMTSMFDDNVETRVRDGFINAGRINSPDKFQAFVDGCVNYFQEVAKDNAEDTKSDVLAGVIFLLHIFLVKKETADLEVKRQTIDLSKLHQSLDNLIIESSFTQGQIKELKQSLSLSSEEQIVLHLKNMKSRNTSTRLNALFELVGAFETAVDKQVAILEAMIGMLKDNDSACINGYNALGQIQLLILHGKIDNAEKLQTMVDGFANYLWNPGAIIWKSLFQDNGNARILDGMIEKLLFQFMNKYRNQINEQNIDLTQLWQSLKDLHSSIPDDSTTTSIKEKIQRIKDHLNVTSGG